MIYPDEEALAEYPWDPFLFGDATTQVHEIQFGNSFVLARKHNLFAIRRNDGESLHSLISC